ncbi:putative nicotianamine synthase [Helianthus annuus]|nr:putative nicotianamine synthase [Helianthus annuus]
MVLGLFFISGYPQDLQGFEVLSVFHPVDDVINSVVIARKNIPITSNINHHHHHHDHWRVDLSCLKLQVL